MPRRLWLSLAMLAIGSGLLVAAQLASAAPERRGGIFKVGTTGASVQIDPQLAYITTAWWLEYATAAKLYNYRPGGKLVPEVASRFKVSRDGRKYTFFIRKGFRFSDGTRVTAASFVYAIDRAANHDLSSPAAQFITDTSEGGVDIAGAFVVHEGNGIHVSGAQARGNKLTITLNRPSGRLISILTLPFFQATSMKLPLQHEVVNVTSMSDLPTAGPYAFTLNDPNRLTSLRRNPYWKRGPGRTAPRNLAGLDLQWNLNEQTAFEMVKANELDEGPVPAAEVQGIANQYGVNKRRFWVKPVGCLGWIALNTRQGLFKDNAPLRQAVNWAIDRTDFLANASPYSMTPWTHLIPPGFPGAITKRALQPYGPRADMDKARQIAAGHYGDGRVVLAYRAGGPPNPRVELVRRNLTTLGLDVTLAPYFDFPPPRSQWDLLLGYGYCLDATADPGDFVTAVKGSLSPEYVAKLLNANRLSGEKRLKAFGKLDVEIMKKDAPAVVTNTYNNRFFFSNRVDPKSLEYHAVFQDWSIPSLALK
jgi:ABC-type oligopeptide transport system substrate-binding subunit